MPEIIVHLSRFVRLAPGDVITTGTPPGVGPVAPGDELVGAVERVGTVPVRYATAGDVEGVEAVSIRGEPTGRTCRSRPAPSRS